MISCPQCKATLPDWAQTCQFCQANVQKVPRPKPVVPERKAWNLIPAWVWPAYYALCAFFVLQGIGGIAQTIASSHQKFMGEEIGLGPFAFISMAIDGFTILLGIGLALRVELARGIVNFFCGLRIFFGLLSLAGSVLGSFFAGAFGVLMVVLNIINIATAAFMIYLIGETDTRAPGH